MKWSAGLFLALSVIIGAAWAGQYVGPKRSRQGAIYFDDSSTRLLTSTMTALGRQFPTFWQSLTSPSSALSRQIFDMLDIVTDVAMLTLLGIPILGLVALGATALQPIVGATGAGRKKRAATEDPGFLDRAGKALIFARDLYEVLADLEAVFDQHNIKGDACQHKVICEVHRVGKNSNYGPFGDKIVDLLNMEKKLENDEIIPITSMMFASYRDAAQRGTKGDDCANYYRECRTDLMEFLAWKKAANGKV